MLFFFFFSSRRRHTRWTGDWSSDVCSSDLAEEVVTLEIGMTGEDAPMLARLANSAVIARSERHNGTLAVTAHCASRSEERRVGKGVDLGGRRIMKKKKEGSREERETGNGE